VAARWSIGLTGAVGAGKTSVLDWLARHGCSTLDADAVVHRVLASDDDVVRALTQRFGADVVSSHGIDRQRLADVVFADRQAMADLERLVHPPVLTEIRAWLGAATGQVAVVEGALLLEAGLTGELDRFWLVTCPRSQRLARLVDRGWSEAEALRRMSASAPLAAQLAAADTVIDNGGAWSATERQLELALRRLEARPEPGRAA
jgi:dephospho-CoA kinase